MATELDDFEATDAASDPELRVLLRQGDAQQQVWAAWRLALRHGTGAESDIGAQAGAARDIGTRRNLLIVLAGLGERDILRALAEHEPDPLLRGEARVLVWRTAEDRSLATEVVRGWLTTETDAGVLARLIDVSPPLPTVELAPALWTVIATAREVDPRRAAWGKLLDECGSSPRFEWRRMLDEPDVGLRRSVLAQWAASERHRELLAFAETERGRSKELLTALLEKGRRYPWDELRHLRGRTECTDLLLDLLDAPPYPTEARLWLFGLLELDAADEKARGFHPMAWHHALRAYADAPAGALTERELATAARLERSVREFDAREDPGAPDFDPYWDPMWGARAFLEATGHDPGRIERYAGASLDDE